MAYNNPVISTMAQGAQATDSGMRIADSMMKGIMQSMNHQSDLLFKYDQMLRLEEHRKLDDAVKMQNLMMAKQKFAFAKEQAALTNSLNKRRVSAYERNINSKTAQLEQNRQLLMGMIPGIIGNQEGGEQQSTGSNAGLMPPVEAPSYTPDYSRGSGQEKQFFESIGMPNYVNPNTPVYTPGTNGGTPSTIGQPIPYNKAEQFALVSSAMSGKPSSFARTLMDIQRLHSKGMITGKDKMNFLTGTTKTTDAYGNEVSIPNSVLISNGAKSQNMNPNTISTANGKTLMDWYASGVNSLSGGGSRGYGTGYQSGTQLSEQEAMNRMEQNFASFKKANSYNTSTLLPHIQTTLQNASQQGISPSAALINDNAFVNAVTAMVGSGNAKVMDMGYKTIEQMRSLSDQDRESIYQKIANNYIIQHASSVRGDENSGKIKMDARNLTGRVGEILKQKVEHINKSVNTDATGFDVFMDIANDRTKIGTGFKYVADFIPLGRNHNIAEKFAAKNLRKIDSIYFRKTGTTPYATTMTMLGEIRNKIFGDTTVKGRTGSNIVTSLDPIDAATRDVILHTENGTEKVDASQYVFPIPAEGKFDKSKSLGMDWDEYKEYMKDATKTNPDIKKYAQYNIVSLSSSLEMYINKNMVRTGDDYNDYHIDTDKTVNVQLINMDTGRPQTVTMEADDATMILTSLLAGRSSAQ